MSAAGSGRKAASEPLNELSERRLSTPRHMQLQSGRQHRAKLNRIHYKEKIEMEMSRLTSALPFVVPRRQRAPVTVCPPKSVYTRPE